MANRYTASYLQDGRTLGLTAPYDCAGGDGALVGAVFGVAKAAVTSGSLGEFAVEGVHSLPKTSAQAWATGQSIFWDPTNKRLDSSSTVGPRVGFATADAANPSSTGQIKLDPSPNRASGVVAGSPAPTSIATAGAATYTAAQVLSRTMVRDPNGASRTDTFPTAALLVAAVPGAAVGDLIELLVINGADAAETITLTEGAGGGWDTNQTSSSRVIPQNAQKTVRIRLTNVTAASEAYVMYA